MKPIKIEEQYNKLCDYECGQIAKYKFMNGKYCCESNQSKCPEIIKKIKNKMTPEKREEISKQFKELWKNKDYRQNQIDKYKQKKHLKFQKINTNELCILGCGQKAKFISKHKKLFCSEHVTQCPIHKKKNTRSGKLSGMYGKSQSQYCKDVNSKMRLGVPLSEEHREKIKISHNTPQFKENVSKRMKEWQSIYMLKKIKNPSKPELMLRKEIFELFPDISEHSYQVLNYCLDVAIPKYKIGIEFDGHYHFHTKEAIEYFKIRREKIEKEGWVLISYTMYDTFPSKEKILKDIQKELYQ